MPALAGLPLPPPQSLIISLLHKMRKDEPSALSHTSPRRLASLAQSFRSLNFKPDFGFLHCYAQAVRFYWNSFEPWVSHTCVCVYIYKYVCVCAWVCMRVYI